MAPPTPAAPSPLLIAAIPFFIAALTAAKTAKNTIITGDPLTAGQRALPALQIFVSTVELQLPALGSSELQAGGTVFDSQVDGLIAKLQALQAAAPPAA